MTMKKNVLPYEWLVILMLAMPTIGAADNNGVRYHVSLGTSLSVGIQPDASGTNQLTDDGYADQLFDIIEGDFRKIRLVKLGCPGETTTTMMAGGICTYSEGSQLAQAVEFLHAHKDKVELITIDLGVNDVLAAGCIDGTDVDVACVIAAFNQVATKLPVILTVLQSAANEGTPIVGMNYYNSFLAFWLTGIEGQVLAMESAALLNILNNDVLGVIYDFFSIPVADVAGAFQSNEFATMVELAPDFFVPLNVALICQWTYMCVPPPVGPNIHANPTGYGVIAGEFVAVLPPLF